MLDQMLKVRSYTVSPGARIITDSIHLLCRMHNWKIKTPRHRVSRAHHRSPPTGETSVLLPARVLHGEHNSLDFKACDHLVGYNRTTTRSRHSIRHARARPFQPCHPPTRRPGPDIPLSSPHAPQKICLALFRFLTNKFKVYVLASTLWTRSASGLSTPSPSVPPKCNHPTPSLPRYHYSRQNASGRKSGYASWKPNWRDAPVVLLPAPLEDGDRSTRLQGLILRRRIQGGQFSRMYNHRLCLLRCRSQFMSYPKRHQLHRRASRNWPQIFRLHETR